MGAERPADQQPRTLWTIGHSTRSADELVAMLRAHGIQALVDVRSIPFSRRNPQFNSPELAKALPNVEIAYRSAQALGGRRKARPDSINRGWRNASFRGYADYLQTAEFRSALDDLLAHARVRPTAIMCAEAVPWRCHRSLIADAAALRGWAVRHILSAERADPHQLTSFARLVDGSLAYPG